MRSVPILTYHEISARAYSTYRKFTVTPDDFRRQMAWLARKRYHTISLDELMAYRAGQRRLRSKAILLTFDDGCRECVEHATTVLREHGFTATFYLVAGFMGATTGWMKQQRNLELPLIDWGTARQLTALGFSCGSHTVNHQRLAELPLDRCREELYRSKATLENGLGRDIVHLSYPFGSSNAAVRTIAAEAGYRTAVTIERGLSGPAHDALALPRITVGGDESFRDFTFRVRTSKRVDELLPKPMYLLGSRARRLLKGSRARLISHG